ncbi:MAG: AAA family ATPase [Sphaerochaeta sp.]|nr:AAA family ATPase [Sphaerochaeta sp.]
MKILELRFKNLNSLYGEWHIDFSDPEYAYNGIFALTGPTGAGKSTILDAICLALYGSTPRLGRITQSSNDIMSRQTGECFAEVVFASREGTYRCHWSHHRSRRRAEGELQSPKHEISEANEEGKVLETKLTAVLALVEEKTGMDFDRFTRSILLAQGGFDTFLKATVEQKSKILEQITGTKIYSDISVAVHERLRQERATLSEMEAETRGIIMLSDEEESLSTASLLLAQQEEGTLRALVSDLSKAITWLTGIAHLEDEVKALAEQEELLASDVHAFAVERNCLESALKAATLEGSYATLLEMRSQQKGEASSLQKEEQALPLLEAQAKQGSEALAKAEESTSQAKKAQKEAAPLLKQVRSLDQSIQQHASSISEGKASIAEDRASIESYKKKREEEAKKVSCEQEKLVLVETYLSEHEQDKALVTELTGINEQIQALASKQKEVEKKEDEVEKADKALKGAEKALASCEKLTADKQTKLDRAMGDLTEKRDELSRLLGDTLLREYRERKDTLLREREFLARIAALEEHRNALVDGKECPLCGSLDHPFALGNVPKPDETERNITALTKIIVDAETLETTIQHLLNAERDALSALAEQKKLESGALHAKESALIAQTSSLVARDEAKESYAVMEKGMGEKLKAYGIEEISADLSSLLASLRLRKDAWLTKEDEKKSIENSINAIKGELLRLAGVLDTQELALGAKQEALEALAASHAVIAQDRHKLYGDKDPDREEESLSDAVHDAETAERKAGRVSSDLVQKVSTARTRIEALQASLVGRKPLLESKEALFLEELSSVGFSDETLFISARLPVSDRNRLSIAAKALDERHTALKTTMQDRTTRLALEQEKNLTESPLIELQSSLGEKEAALEARREAIADLKATLKKNGEARQRIASKQTLIEKQKRELTKWERLHALIGSADGKKFRNFAQGLTFELMVGHANRQLAKMSDRYLLIRSDEQPLELNVIDNYQAGEIRSTKNLSGGESFIVSLTLALGLSKMASRKVRVDSLFLDEGFGTLDEESLETALKTLSSLQQDGKLIGVISHVSAMQEMISTQIVISPTSGGRSIVSGPGCSKVE